MGKKGKVLLTYQKGVSSMKRSKFSLSHYKLFSCKMGQLIPVTWYEALPGDTIQQSTSALIRCAPLVTPVMHNVDVRFHTWFVPNRIIWDGWENFITGGPDGMDASDIPYSSFAGPPAEGSLADYVGIPTVNPTTQAFSTLPFRAYTLIWNEFYRDQDLQTPATLLKTAGLDATSYDLQNVCWEKDYLTSSRPWALKGPAVTLPLGSTAAVSFHETGATPGLRTLFRDNSTANAALRVAEVGTNNAPFVGDVDLTNATAVDINTVRHAFALQRYEEARARYGSRYTEYLRAAFGVRCSDARLQRPEYLGGGKTPIQFSEVLQTGVTTSGTQSGVGTMFGHGISALRTNRFRRFFEEHGIVMTLMSVRPKTMYMQRTKRAFFRGFTFPGSTFGTKEDWWQKELQHIGQQGVYGWEVDSSWAGGDDTPFGYQDRYDEYRREESSVAGAFRSTLSTWHLARDFGSPPALNDSFVSCVPSTRIFADTDADNLYVMANHSIQARRVIAREGTSVTF